MFKKYRKTNEKHIKDYNKKHNKKYHKKNKNKNNKRIKKYYNSKANFNTFALQISYADPVKDVNGYLQTKCAYCGKWYFPIISSVRSRILALNGKSSGKGTENRLYCSKSCKQECPVYNQYIWPKKFKQATSREVQPQLRQIVFKRDSYTCQKCGSIKNLHCHHVEGIRWEPLESADIDKCATLCKSCHIAVHKLPDCNYYDMRCNKKN